MELEELMTNRVLLEKMSDNDVHSTYRKHPKHVLIQENHTKPKEIRIEYKNSHNNISYTTDRSMTPPPPPLVIEGYGCKCPHKLKRVMKVLWTVLVILYIFGMPIMLVHMHTKLLESEVRLNTIEKQLYDHLNADTSREVKVQASRQTNDKKGDEGTGDGNTGIPSNAINDYKEKNYKDVLARLNEMKLLVDEHKERISFIENLQVWFNATKNGTNSNGQKCFCFSNLAARSRDLIQNKGTSTPSTSPQGNCECNKVTIGLPGPQGPRGPRGPPGQPVVIDEKMLEKYKGGQGSTGVQGESGDRGLKGKPGSNGTCFENCDEKPKISTTYTHWGRQSCSNSNETVYKGYIGSAFHTQEGGGTNYLCLPEKPMYGNYDSALNEGNRAFIYGVEFELGDSNLFEAADDKSGHYNAKCSVCKVNGKSNTIMVPATTTCPQGWRSQYSGFLMAQKRYLKRTEYICVDKRPDLDESTVKWDKGGFLHFVETRCGALPCRSNRYMEYRELSCVVCSS